LYKTDVIGINYVNAKLLKSCTLIQLSSAIRNYYDKFLIAGIKYSIVCTIVINNAVSFHKDM